jgi:single-strand DNA-binding protein
MAGTNINRVILTGNLTKNPEVSSLPSGTSVCTLRIACNSRRKNSQTGEWEEQPNYFDVTVWGAQGENCAKYLSRGRGVAVDGRLRWREWTTPEGQKRSAVDIVAESVQFLGGGQGEGNGNGYSAGQHSQAPTHSDIPVDNADFEPAPVPAAVADDDIPF